MNKKILMVLASERFRDIEYIVPRAFFEQQGCKVFTSSSTSISTGRFGYNVKNDILNSEINKDHYDAIFLVGGIGSLQYLEDFALAQKFEEFMLANKPVVAICAAPRNLANWGLARGKEITGHNGDGTFDEYVSQKGAIPKSSLPVVKDGILLTGNGPEASEEIAIQLMKMLQ